MKLKKINLIIALFSAITLVTFSFTLSTDVSFAASERDYDKDGIVDSSDKCPLRSETYNQFQDFDGCPDSISEEIVPFEAPDMDSDGIEDRLDSCPNEPETINDYLDKDGCPEIVPGTINLQKDSDFDTIIDSEDDCPTEKENFNGLKDDDGCSDSWNSAIDEELKKSANLENQCRPGKVLVIRLNYNDSVCVSLETAKKWESYGIIKSLEVPPTEVPPTEVPPTEVP
ncbi:MAG: thrombospondin type 3 repeat-containing protein, partial [Nitrosopumilaceae archaeon]